MIEELKMEELHKRSNKLQDEKEMRQACNNNFYEFKDV